MEAKDIFNTMASDDLALQGVNVLTTMVCASLSYSIQVLAPRGLIALNDRLGYVFVTQWVGEQTVEVWVI